MTLMSNSAAYILLLTLLLPPMCEPRERTGIFKGFKLWFDTPDGCVSSAYQTRSELECISRCNEDKCSGVLYKSDKTCQTLICYFEYKVQPTPAPDYMAYIRLFSCFNFGEFVGIYCYELISKDKTKIEASQYCVNRYTAPTVLLDPRTAQQFHIMMIWLQMRLEDDQFIVTKFAYGSQGNVVTSQGLAVGYRLSGKVTSLNKCVTIGKVSGEVQLLIKECDYMGSHVCQQRGIGWFPED